MVDPDTLFLIGLVGLPVVAGEVAGFCAFQALKATRYRDLTAAARRTLVGAGVFACIVGWLLRLMLIPTHALAMVFAIYLVTRLVIDVRAYRQAREARIARGFSVN